MSGRLSLAERRKRRRRSLAIASGIAFTLFLSVLIYASWKPGVRIAQIEVYGFDASLALVANTVLEGSYLGIVPRDSILFYPERAIRREIMRSHGDIAAVSLFRNGLTGLTLRVTTRVPIARWCGPSYVPPTASSSPQGECYLFDDRGYLYATSSEITLVNQFVLYAPLDASATEPRGAVLPQADTLPSAFTFARELGRLGGTVEAVAIRGSEVDQYLTSGTRITYVRGQEEQAFAALVSAKENLNLSSGLVEYVDLRFEGKVYMKRKGASVAE